MSGIFGRVPASHSAETESFYSLPLLLVAIMLFLSARKLCLFAGSVVIALSVVGCAEPVREDRTVEFTRDGGQVAFQHGDEGVYVASADGKGVTKIFQPDETVLATSRPLSSPTDGRLIFTTAQPLEPEAPRPPGAIAPTPAEGRIVFQRPIRYTCWIRSEAKGDQPAAVKKLFDAPCGHIGYVSAALAVRWHPDGQHILYCASLDQDASRHTIFEFDLASEKSRRVFPHAASAVICDWTPAGSHLVCVASDLPQKGAPHPAASAVDQMSGTWIGLPADDKSWWRVPGSERLAEGELPSVIEMLRASRPAWTRDDSQFVFVSQLRSTDPAIKPTHNLERVEFASRKITTLVKAEGPITDLNWSPDGQRLGYVQRDAVGTATLNVLDPQGAITKLPTTDSIRKFAGFDATGKQLAYVVAGPTVQPPETKQWAVLLIRNPLAWDRVRIAAADGTAVGADVFSGLRVTFPLWSPTEEKLSLWLTFTPRYLSLLSTFLQAGLRPGDPAATIDTKTGAISWMAVTPQEELQVGHYHLLQKDPAAAWIWYEKARQQMPAAKPPANWQEFARQVGSPENSQPFEALCLKRLGRDAEAAAKWDEFDKNFFPAPPAPRKPGDPIPADDRAAEAASTDLLTQMFGQQTELVKPLIHDLYLAEVFLSVDSLEDGLAHFSQAPAAAETDSVAFSRAVVLAQLMLIGNDHEGYLKHSTEVLAPLALKLWQADKPDQPAEINNGLLQFVAGLCLAPLFRTEFISQLPKEAVERHRAAWKEHAAKHESGPPALAINLVLRAIAASLNDAAETKLADERIAKNPAAQPILSGRPIDEVTATWFEFAQTNGLRR